jgi:hypothetical protein
MKKQVQYQSLKKAASMLRKRGQGGDSVLAHISPEEARYMQERFGNDVNPHTGLPQFGLFRKVEKMLRKPFKMAAPVAGSIIGGMFGGPAGAIAGGSIGGALTSKRHMLDHALGGAAVGLGHSILSPMVGGAMNLDPGSMLGRASMMGSPSLGSQMGLGAAGASQFFGKSNQPSNQQESSGAQGAGESGGLFGMGLLNTGLLGATLAGTLLAKKKMPEYGSPENESMQQAVQKNKHQWAPELAYRPSPEMKREAKFPPKGYRKTKWKFFPTPEEQEEQLLEAQQEMAEPGYERRYAKGGRVKGYYDGSDGGQSDKIPVDLPEDAYILDATHISLSGDGNSLHGAKQNRKFLDSFQKNGISRDEGNAANVKALVSDGEMYVSPKEVKAVGGGSIAKGVKKLDKFRNNLRKHKGIKKFLPPKSKPLIQYLR